MNQETKQCQNCKQSFVIEPDDFTFYEKMGVLAPTECPDCRQQLRMLYRNFKTLYKRPSTKSSKMIVSMYNPDVPFPVYDISEWWGDTWDALDYGREIDWSKPFFGQLQDLFNSVPHLSLVNTKSENCEYSNMVYGSKNCYFIFGCLSAEECEYGHIVWDSRDSADNLYVFKCELCYECVDCLNCNKLLYSQECENCSDGVGLFDCRNCINCIGCVGLANKSYCIFNQQVTKEEYAKFVVENPIHDPRVVQKILLQMEKLRKTVPQRSFFGSHNNVVSGNHIYNAHNIHNSFDIRSGEDSKYCFTIRKAIDTYDASFTSDIEESYQILFSVGARIIGSHLCIDSHDIYYSDHCFGSSNLFGCFGLRQKSYCIFNKQYTKEEYQLLLPKLIGLMKKNNEWGKFFPKELSPFAYNESIVNEYMPLTKEKAEEQGYRWRDDIPSTKGQETVKHEELPFNPNDYTDDLTKEILACTNCGKNYKMIKREINLYKTLKLSLPLNCFDCRHQKRMRMRNPRQLWSGTCAKCVATIKTSYSSEAQKVYKMYCEQCYQQEVV